MVSKIKSMIYLIALFALPIVSYAQFGGSRELTDFGLRIVKFINDVLVPFVFAVALLFFIYGMVNYFILGADNDDKKKAGKPYIIWSILAFVVMVSIWGITNLIAGGLNLDDPDAINDLLPQALEKR